MSTLPESKADTRVDGTALSESRDTTALQCAATLLIANSHLEKFYPWSWMAADGLLGNSLFFLLSGYGLMCSAQRTSRSFADYYWRRVLRIYPLLVIVVLIFEIGFNSAWKTWNAGDYIRHLIYPTQYGYITQIMAFYIAFYFICRFCSRRGLLTSLACSAVPFAWLYLNDVFTGVETLQLGVRSPALWWVFFFQMMLIGALLATPGNRRPPVASPRAWVVLALLLLAYIGCKFAMVKGWVIPGVALPAARFYVVLLLLTATSLWLAFHLGTSQGFLQLLQQGIWGRRFIALVGGLTLEIYLTHVFLVSSHTLQQVIFPLNVLVFFVIAVVIAWLTGKGGGFLRELLAGSSRSRSD